MDEKDSCPDLSFRTGFGSESKYSRIGILPLSQEMLAKLLMGSYLERCSRYFVARCTEVRSEVQCKGERPSTYTMTFLLFANGAQDTI